MARHESAHTAMVDLKRSNARDSSWSSYPEQFQSTGRQTQQGAQTDVVAFEGCDSVAPQDGESCLREESEGQPSGNFGPLPWKIKVTVSCGWRHGGSPYSRCRCGRDQKE